MSCLVLSRPVLSCLVPTCLVPSCPVLSRPVLSCLVLAFQAKGGRRQQNQDDDNGGNGDNGGEDDESSDDDTEPPLWDWGVLGGACVFGFKRLFHVSRFPFVGSSLPALRGARLVFALCCAFVLSCLVFSFFSLSQAKDNGDQEHHQHNHDGTSGEGGEGGGIAEPPLRVWGCWVVRAFASFLRCCVSRFFLLPLYGVKLAHPSG